jgi:hypothetical protein
MSGGMITLILIFGLLPILLALPVLENDKGSWWNYFAAQQNHEHDKK